MPDKNTIYIIGLAKSQKNNPITQQFGRFLLGFTLDKDTGFIHSCGSTVVMPSTYDFINELFADRNLLDDEENIKSDIENRYFGASQKALIAAYRDAQRRFRLYKQGARGEILTKQDEFSQ